MNTFRIKTFFSRYKLLGLVLFSSSLLVFWLSACYSSYLPDEGRPSQTLPVRASNQPASQTPTRAAAASTCPAASTAASEEVFPAAALALTSCEMTIAVSPPARPSQAASEPAADQPGQTTNKSSSTTAKKTKNTTAKKTKSTTSKPSSCPTTSTASSRIEPEPAAPESTSGTSASQVKADPGQEMFLATNSYRQKNGLPPFKSAASAMTAAARRRARELALSFDHRRPDGSSFSTALQEAGVSYSCAAENIANFPANASPADVLAKWAGSSGHQANILHQDLTCLAIGYYSHNGRDYWVQLFTDN